MQKSALRSTVSLSQFISSMASKVSVSTYGVPLLLIAITAPILFTNLSNFPVAWFDEGVKTNLIRTLAERGVYATYSVDGYHIFDNSVTNGPVETMVDTLSFKLFGSGIVQARLVTALFAILAIQSLYGIAVLVYGRAGGLFSILFLLAMPAIDGVGLILLGRQVMSEVPSLSLLGLGLLLWFYSWGDKNKLWLGILGGVLMGCGLLSKTQNAVSIVPAGIILVILMTMRGRTRPTQLYLPILAMIGVLVAWTIIAMLGATELDRRTNATFMAEAIPTLLITNLFGRALNRSGTFVMVMMLIAGITTAGYLLTSPKQMRFRSNAQWAETLLALYVLCHALWFGFISVGWTRYAFAGWVFALLLLGGVGWRVVQWIRRWMEQVKPLYAPYVFPVAWTILFLALLLTNGRFWLHANAQTDNAAQEIADYIRMNVPAQSVIESWDWQVDVLSGHWQYHHPAESYEFEVDRRLFHKLPDTMIGYDLLQANPDYLLIGPFSDWTQIYDYQAIAQNFDQLTQLGPYALYQRRR